MINGEKETPKSEVTLGTIYDINKSLIKQKSTPLTEEELVEKKELIKEFFSNWADRYFMLLCKEQSDYTVFNLSDREEAEADAAKILVEECLKNRGSIRYIDKQSEGAALEIWLMIEDNPYCYYLFPYNIGIIEV